MVEGDEFKARDVIVKIGGFDVMMVVGSDDSEHYVVRRMLEWNWCGENSILNKDVANANYVKVGEAKVEFGHEQCGIQ